MTNPGEISRTFYSTNAPAQRPPIGDPVAGHFSQLCGSAVGLFVPLIGVNTALAGAPLSATETIGYLPHETWRSLENRRYRDLFQAFDMLQPRTYYCRLFPQLESDAAGLTFAQALVRRDTPEHASMAMRLDALMLGLLTGESGLVVSPTRVPLTVTHGFMRLRLRANRFRFYSWSMEDTYRPIIEKIQGGGEQELNELPTMTFAARSLMLDESLAEHVASVMRTIEEHRVFDIVPELYEIARRYLRCSDPSNSRSIRLLDVITAFELAFGGLSPKHQRKTMARLASVMRETEFDIPDPAVLNAFRNAIAHGRTRDDAVNAAFPVVELAVRMFVTRAIFAVADTQAALATSPHAFEMLQNVLFRT